MATVIENSTVAQAEPGVTALLRRFTVEEYYLMGEAGIFRPEERLELIEGEIHLMSPRGPKHSSSITYASDCFRKYLGRRVIIRTQDAIHLDDYSEPEPDLVLAVPPKRRYIDHHPTPSEILLVLEIAESSLAQDRQKSRVYAKAGIIQYCLLNLKTEKLEDHRNPGPAGYRSKETYQADQSFNLVAFPDIWIGVAELLPRA